MNLHKSPSVLPVCCHLVLLTDEEAWCGQFGTFCNYGPNEVGARCIHV